MNQKNEISLVDENFDRKRLDLLKANYAKEASDLEFELFINNCKKFGLSPEAGQIYCIGRKEFKTGQKVFTTQPSLQGLRVAANRTGEFQGQTVPEYLDSETEKWQDYWIKDTPPAAARVGIYRKDFAAPVMIPLRFDSYAQKFNGKLASMWAKMPEHMLQKCATAASIRAAFPDLVSGLYIKEEAHLFEENEPIKIEPVDDDRLQKMIKAFEGIGYTIQKLESIIGKSIRMINKSDFEYLQDQFKLIKSGNGNHDTKKLGTKTTLLDKVKGIA